MRHERSHDRFCRTRRPSTVGTDPARHTTDCRHVMKDQRALLADVSRAQSAMSDIRIADDRVDAVVLRLNAICRTATVDVAMAVGSLVIETFYSGDLTSWRTRGPKHASLRKVAKHPQLLMSSGSLYRCVAIYEMC